MSEPGSGTRLLGEVFWRLRRRVLWIASCSGLGWAAVLGALSVLVGIWLDLLLELSPSVRIGALVSALLIAAGAIVALVRQGLRAHQLRRLARQLDDVIGSGGEIGSGVDLAGLLNEGRCYETSTLTAGLSALAVARAARLATSVSPTRVISSKPLRRSIGTCVALGAAVFLLVLALPKLARTEWLRFIDPFGDHPPYSRLTFNVTPGNTRVVYGQGLDIQVDVDGPAPDRLQLVVMCQSLTKSAAPENETFPMFPEADRTWRASIMQVTEPLRYFVRSGSVRSHHFTVQVITVPRIEEARFRITWPEYTRRAAYDGPLPREGLSGLPGTRVDVTTRSNRPLAEGTLRLFAKSGESTIALRPNAGNDSEVSGSFTIRETGRIEIRVTDTQCQASTDLFTAPVTVLPDNRPFVRLLEPRSVSFATPDAMLPVVIAAEDDFGLRAAELFRNLNDSPYRSMSLDIPSPSPTRINDHVLLPLRDFGLEPGDEIKLFARVTDNDPTTAVDSSTVGQFAAATGKGAESAIAVIRIISVEEFQRLRQTQDSLDSLLSKYQQAERRVESLLEEIDALRETLDKEPADAKLNDEHRRKLAELSERLTQETEALQKLAKSELPFELDRELRPALQRLAQSIEAAAKEMPEMSKGSPCAACSGA